MDQARIVLVGSVIEVFRSGLSFDKKESVTLSVEGAEPLYGELRLPNRYGWTLGQRLVITIAAEESDAVVTSAAA